MKTIIIATLALVVTTVTAYAMMDFSHQKQPTTFFAGHSHVDGKTINAPSHSGGTDSRGCHNASVPYHCH